MKAQMKYRQPLVNIFFSLILQIFHRLRLPILRFMGGSRRVVEIVVECSTIRGEIGNHSIYIHSNGFVETSGHDNSSWGLDGQTYEFLGGPKDHNPCLWWKKINIAEQEEVIWHNGTFQVKNWDNALFDVSSWKVKQLAYATKESLDSTIRGFGISKSSNDFLVDNMSSSIIEDYTATIQIVKQEFSETVYFSHLQELLLSCSLDEVKTWINEGIPYSSIVPLKFLGVPVEVASDICEAYSRRWRVSSQPYSLGSPEYWVSCASREGMDISRIADYMNRTLYNGVWYWRVDVYDKVVAKCLENNVFFPTTWIVEAVASIPDREVLSEYTKGKNFIDFTSRTPFQAVEKSFSARSQQWTRGWAYEVGADRIYNNLISLGDPKNWELGWEYPTLEEIKNDYYEEIVEGLMQS